MDPDEFERLLNGTGYDPTETKFIVDGFRNGFSLGYQGNPQIRLKSPNLRTNGPEEIKIIWNKVMKEVSAKRYAGPICGSPF